MSDIKITKNQIEKFIKNKKLTNILAFCTYLSSDVEFTIPVIKNGMETINFIFDHIKKLFKLFLPEIFINYDDTIDFENKSYSFNFWISRIDGMVLLPLLTQCFSTYLEKLSNVLYSSKITFKDGIFNILCNV